MLNFSPKSRRVRAVFRRWVAMGGMLAAALGLAVSLAHAAPHRQTRTPTPTHTLPAVPPPPVDGGVVAAEDFMVYEGPGQEFAELGGVPYGAYVYPKARTQDGLWLLVDYAGFEGWVYRPFVLMGYDPLALPIPEPFVTLLPGTTPAELGTLTVGVTPSATPAPPEATPSPPPSATPVPTPTESAAEVAAPNPTPQQPSTPETNSPGLPGVLAQIGLGRLAVIVAGVVGVALSVRYLLLTGGRGVLTRGEFVGSECPACREGTLSREDRGRSQRVVRCDNCRSVLRQLRSGLWRYAVDPLPDPEFAERYNGQALDEEDFVAIAKRRASGGQLIGRDDG